MRPVFLFRLLIVPMLALAFFAGRFSVPQRSGSGADTAPRPNETASPATGRAEADTRRVGAGKGFGAAETLDPAIKIDSLMATVANEPPGLARLALLHAALQRITRENWSEAFETMWKGRLEGKISEEEMQYVLQRLGEVAGSAPLEAVKPKDPVNAYETRWGRYAMKGWAETDPAAAKAWLETQPVGKFREGMAWGYVLGASLRDTSEAMRTMQEVRPSEQSRLLCWTLDHANGHRYEALAEAWLTANNPTGPPAIRDKNDGVTAVFDSLLGAQITAGNIVKKNDKFFEWVATIEEKPYLGPRSVTRIAEEFTRRNETGRGLEWVERLTSEQPKLGDMAVQTMIAQMTMNDATAAAGWLNEHGDSPHYDYAVAAFLAAQHGKIDKETAQAWASSIRDEKLRERLMHPAQ